MDQQRAVAKIMTTIKLEGIIPGNLHHSVRYYLTQAYAVGYDEARNQMLDNSAKKIAQINRDNKVVNIFNTVKKAALMTGYDSSSISKWLSTGRYNRHGHLWRYLQNDLDYEVVYKHQKYLI